MRLNPISFLSGLAALLLTFSIDAKPTRFEIKDVAFRNLIQFTSDATLEKTVGTSHFINGWVEFDLQSLKSGIKGEFEVDTRSFEMGPDSKAAKLRDTLLGAGEFPGASYKLDKIESSGDDLSPGKSVSARVSGMLTVRGVNRRHEMQVKATYFPQSEATAKRLGGNLLKMAVTFDISLSDIRFAIPDALTGLLAPTIKVSVDMVGTDQLPVSTP